MTHASEVKVQPANEDQRHSTYKMQPAATVMTSETVAPRAMTDELVPDLDALAAVSLPDLLEIGPLEVLCADFAEPPLVREVALDEPDVEPD